MNSINKSLFAEFSIVASFVATNAIDIVVIACNTASAIVLPTSALIIKSQLLALFRQSNLHPYLPIKRWVLIATPATITREYTHELIKTSRVIKGGRTFRFYSAGGYGRGRKLRGGAINLEELEQILQTDDQHG
ncbi:hypothetical protein O9992_08345 [Vibrio lentus]|nr:hypothetical protein [Vibrio lentus]